MIPAPNWLARFSVTMSKNLAGLLALFFSCDNVLRDFMDRFADGRHDLTVLGRAEPLSVASLGGAFVIAVVYYSVRGAARFSYRRKLSNFFGIDSTQRIVFVIPSYRCVGNESGAYGSFGPDAFHESGPDMFYKAAADRTFQYKKAFQAPICASTDVSAYFFAVRTLGPTGIDFSFEIDEDFINPDRLLPRAKSLSCRSVICFGSASSNYVARYLNQIPFFQSDPNTYSFYSTNQLIKHKISKRRVAGTDLTHLVANESTDYAVIAKYRLEGTVFFVCAGIDQAGSVAATQILLDRWRELGRLTKGKDFFLIYKVNRKALRPEELYTEPGATELLYTHIPSSPESSDGRANSRRVRPS